MGLLKSVLSLGGAAIGGAVGGPAGAKIGAALGGAAGGALSSSSGSKKATAAQLAAQAEARKAYGQAYDDVKGYQSPFLPAGPAGVNALTSRLQVGGEAPAAATGGGPNPGTYGDTSLGGSPAPYGNPGAFSYGIDDYEASPGYQYRQDQARKQVLAGAGITGALKSGAALKELYDRGDQIAYQDFGAERAFAAGRYDTERDFDYGLSRDARSDYQDTRNYLTNRDDTQTNNLFRYTGIGQGAAGVLSEAAGRYGDQIAGLAVAGGDARANDALTQGQIGADFSSGLGGAISGFIQPSLSASSYAKSNSLNDYMKRAAAANPQLF